jgi:hypothetical protein
VADLKAGARRARDGLLRLSGLALASRFSSISEALAHVVV